MPAVSNTHVFAVPKEAEFTLVRVIDPLVHRRRAVPVLGLLAVAAAFSVRFLHACAYHRGQAHYTQHM
jgi:hypothetical protein